MWLFGGRVSRGGVFDVFIRGPSVGHHHTAFYVGWHSLQFPRFWKKVHTDGSEGPLGIHGKSKKAGKKSYLTSTRIPRYAHSEKRGENNLRARQWLGVRREGANCRSWLQQPPPRFILYGKERVVGTGVSHTANASVRVDTGTVVSCFSLFSLFPPRVIWEMTGAGPWAG